MRKFLLLNLASGAPLPKPESTTPASIENITNSAQECFRFTLLSLIDNKQKTFVNRKTGTSNNSRIN